MESLLQRGYTVCALVRGGSGPNDSPPGPRRQLRRLVVPNIRSQSDWGPLLRGVSAVVHLAEAAHLPSGADCSIFETSNVAFTERLAAAAALGFLVFNFPPARVFLGDSGSIPLDSLAAAVGIIGWRVYVLWPWWFPAVVSAPFAADATLTLVKRIFAREPFWRAHNKHYDRRLVRVGGATAVWGLPSTH